MNKITIMRNRYNDCALKIAISNDILLIDGGILMNVIFDLNEAL